MFRSITYCVWCQSFFLGVLLSNLLTDQFNLHSYTDSMFLKFSLRFATSSIVTDNWRGCQEVVNFLYCPQGDRQGQARREISYILRLIESTDLSPCLSLSVPLWTIKKIEVFSGISSALMYWFQIPPGSALSLTLPGSII